MQEPTVEIEQRGSIAWVWLNRPEVSNAFDAALVRSLTAVFHALSQDGSVRLVVLAGRGRHFSAGADVNWMKEQGTASMQANQADAESLAHMFAAVAACPKPTVARVHGAAIGGGMGLVAASDIAVAAEGAVFATSEVRLGLIPATIAPYVVRAMGARQAKRLFLTGERVDVGSAFRMGLVHEIASAETLDERIDKVATALLAGAPEAQGAVKRLISLVEHKAIDNALGVETARWIAAQRAGAEAKEGLTAFLEKRSAAWVRQS